MYGQSVQQHPFCHQHTELFIGSPKNYWLTSRGPWKTCKDMIVNRQKFIKSNYTKVSPWIVCSLIDLGSRKPLTRHLMMFIRFPWIIKSKRVCKKVSQIFGITSAIVTLINEHFNPQKPLNFDLGLFAQFGLSFINSFFRVCSRPFPNRLFSNCLNIKYITTYEYTGV